jgi:hypothetical protein
LGEEGWVSLALGVGVRTARAALELFDLDQDGSLLAFEKAVGRRPTPSCDGIGADASGALVRRLGRRRGDSELGSLSGSMGCVSAFGKRAGLW